MKEITNIMKEINNIYEKYPQFFLYKNNIYKSKMNLGFCCQSGWFKLIDDALAEINKLKYSEYVEICQIKESHGRLKIFFFIKDSFKLKYAGNIFKSIFYRISGIKFSEVNRNLIKDVSTIINNISIRSTLVCELCGNENIPMVHSNYWNKTICVSCNRVFTEYTYTTKE